MVTGSVSIAERSRETPVSCWELALLSLSLPPQFRRDVISSLTFSVPWAGFLARVVDTVLSDLDACLLKVYLNRVTFLLAKNCMVGGILERVHGW